jgi:hypothetical protein
MDFELGHTYTSFYQFKPQNLANMEHHKRFKYPSAYHNEPEGLTVSPFVSDSPSQLGPDFLRFLWGLVMLSATSSRLSFKIFPISALALAQAAFQRPPSQARSHWLISQDPGCSF